MSEVIIRDATTADYPRIIGLLQHGNMVSPDRDTTERFTATVQTPGSILVAEMGGIAIGSIQVGDGHGIGLLQGLIVDEKYRGNGIGEQLMTAAEQVLSNRGYTVAELLIDTGKNRLRRWYEQLGYRTEYHCMGMEKRLPSRAERPQPHETRIEETVAFDTMYAQLDFTYPGGTFFLENAHRVNEAFAAAGMHGALVPLGYRSSTTPLASTSPHIRPHAQNASEYIRFLGRPSAPDDKKTCWMRCISHSSSSLALNKRSISPDGYYIARRSNGALEVLTLDVDDDVVDQRTRSGIIGLLTEAVDAR